MAEADVTRPDDVIIRPTDPQDHAAVHDIVSRAFADDPVVAELVGVLREDDAGRRGLDLVAERGGEVVGHIMLSRAWVDAPERLVPVLVMSPLSVAPEWQGRGIGSALVTYALETVQATDYPLVFLEGSPIYYHRFDFHRASRLGFTSPSVRIPDPAFQVAMLPAHEEWMTGALVYPDVFWRLDAVGLRGERLEGVLASLERHRQHD